MSYSTPYDTADYERWARLDYSDEDLRRKAVMVEQNIDAAMEWRGETRMEKWIGVKVADLARYIDQLDKSAPLYVRVDSELRKVKQIEIRPVENRVEDGGKRGFDCLIPDELVVLVGGE